MKRPRPTRRHPLLALAGLLTLLLLGTALATDRPHDLLGPWSDEGWDSSPPPGPRIFEGIRQTAPWQQRMEKPDNHRGDFLHTHGALVASGDAATCASCHAETWCADCHAGLSTPLRIHAPGYVLLHGTEAHQNPASCTSCHTPTRFCASCHVDAGVSPRPGARPLAAHTIHPPGWLDRNSALNHATEAQRDLMSCASCHTGTDCATCHIDINPHGRGFDRRCHSMLQAGAPTCAQCHTSRSRLPMDMVRAHPSCRP